LFKQVNQKIFLTVSARKSRKSINPILMFSVADFPAGAYCSGGRACGPRCGHLAEQRHRAPAPRRLVPAHRPVPSRRAGDTATRSRQPLFQVPGGLSLSLLSGLEKTGLKKNSPVFLGFFCFFVFYVFLHIFPEERVFRVFHFQEYF
jgi:hypothetical protein